MMGTYDNEYLLICISRLVISSTESTKAIPATVTKRSEIKVTNMSEHEAVVYGTMICELNPEDIHYMTVTDDQDNIIEDCEI